MGTHATIGQVLRAKGNDSWSIVPSATAYEALLLMAEKNVGALLVMENGKLVGMFSERDYARKVILQGRSSKTTYVSELMTPTPITITPEETMQECMVLMTSNHIRHVPVMKNQVLFGVVSIGDIVNAIISSQQAEIEDLQNYITVGY